VPLTAYPDAMQSKIASRIAAEVGVPRLLPVLAGISPSDLQSLLLEVYRGRVQKLSGVDLLARVAKTPLLAPSGTDPRWLNAFDRIAFAAAEDFEAVDLSPVCPLGTHFVLGGIDQSNVLSAVRNAEVVGDPTAALALECARRRKDIPGRRGNGSVRLCSDQRVIRLQPFEAPGFTPHFRLFGLVSAGRDNGSNNFEIQSFTEHIRFYLRLFRALNEEGFSVRSPLVEISDLAITAVLLRAAGISREHVRNAVRAHLPGSSERFLAARGLSLPVNVEDPSVQLKELAHQHQFEQQYGCLLLLKKRIFDPLCAEYPEALFRFNFARLEGLGYYTDLCLRISPAASDGARYAVADGGLTDWTARLLQDKKERLLTSGIGTEFICRRYRTES
jgi:hypothetical protein